MSNLADLRFIALTRGAFALVSPEDVERLSKYSWSLSRQVLPSGLIRCYAVRGERRGRGNRKVYMHREILGAEAGGLVDHVRSADSLDNRRGNLRSATRTENNRNSRKAVGTSSKFKGVHWHQRAGKWAVEICANYQRRHLGLFVSEETAARVYDDAARESFGEFALLNFPHQHAVSAGIIKPKPEEEPHA